jgi:hypothetical protein
MYTIIMCIFSKLIQTTVLTLSLYLEKVKMPSLNHLLPHISLQKIDNKIEVSDFSHGHHEDVT